jgi:hypothetical protein
MVPKNMKTFKVTLKTLVGGHGGLLQESMLYFNYGTSFPVFGTMLRDATKLSTIPPIDLDEKSSAKSQTSSSAGSDTASQSSSTHLGGRIQQRDSDLESEIDSLRHCPSKVGTMERSYGSSSALYSQSSQNGPNPQPNLRFSARGYTMADGPWLYRFCCQPPRDAGTAYAEIKDEQSYLKMMDDIKKVSRDDPGSKYTVLMIHVHFHRPHLFGFLLIKPDYGQKGPPTVEGERTTR